MFTGNDSTASKVLSNTLKKRGWKVFTRPYELNIVGVRHPSTKPNHFDDSIHVFYRTESGPWMHHHFPATTDPGSYWLANPIAPKGTAIMAEQQVAAYALGLHRGQYTALVQTKAKVEVIRDPDRDNWLNRNAQRESGFFGINIHRANRTGTTKTIDRHSAGCQVFADATDYALFISLCQKHKGLYGNRFTYSLVDLRSVQRSRALRIGTTVAVAGLVVGGGVALWKFQNKDTQ